MANRVLCQKCHTEATTICGNCARVHQAIALKRIAEVVENLYAFVTQEFAAPGGDEREYGA